MKHLSGAWTAFVLLVLFPAHAFGIENYKRCVRAQAILEENQCHIRKIHANSNAEKRTELNRIEKCINTMSITRRDCPPARNERLIHSLMGSVLVPGFEDRRFDGQTWRYGYRGLGFAAVFAGTATYSISEYFEFKRERRRFLDLGKTFLWTNAIDDRGFRNYSTLVFLDKRKKFKNVIKSENRVSIGFYSIYAALFFASLYFAIEETDRLIDFSPYSHLLPEEQVYEDFQDEVDPWIGEFSFSFSF